MKKETQPDYVEHGSDRHAALLGLRKAEEGDEPQLEGWTLIDLTAFGPAARPEYKREVLRQKVSSLTSDAPAVQSDDPLAPGYAPPLWMPTTEPASGIVA